MLAPMVQSTEETKGISNRNGIELTSDLFLSFCYDSLEFYVANRGLLLLCIHCCCCCSCRLNQEVQTYVEQLGEELAANVVINRLGYILVYTKTNNAFF